MRLPAVRAAIACVCFFALAGCRPAGPPPPTKAELIARGTEFFDKGDFKQAAAAYEQAIRADPRDGEARLKLSYAYQGLGRWPQAARSAINAADLLPQNVEAQLRAAELMLTENRYLDVEARMKAFIAEQPNVAGAWIHLGDAYAHLMNQTWALYTLPEKIKDGISFDGARWQVRSDATREGDVEAEKAFRRALAIDPESVDAALALANFLWAIGRPDEGEQWLRQAADRATGHAAANFALGSYYLSRHRGVEGERYLRRAASSVDYGQNARFSLADLYIEQGRSQDAGPLLDSMIEKEDGEGEVSLRKATLDWKAGRTKEALLQLDALLQRIPNHKGARVAKARILIGERDWDQARPIVKDLVTREPRLSTAHAMMGDVATADGNRQEALREFSEAFQLDPGNEALPLRLARASIAMERGPEALQAARDARTRAPNDPLARLTFIEALVLNKDYATAEFELKPLTAGGSPSPGILVQLGIVQAARGRTSEARTSFTRVLALQRDSFEATNGLVMLDLNSHNVTSARTRAEAALAAHQTDARYARMAARVYFEQHDDALAEKTWRLALTLEPGHVDSAIALSQILARQKRTADAQQVLEDAVARNPRSLPALVALAKLVEDTGDLKDARARYEAIIASDPGQAEVGAHLALLYVDQRGNLDVALTLASGALLKLPNDPAVVDALGWVYVAKNLSLRGRDQLRAAVKLAPANPLYRYHLGFAEARLANNAAARVELMKALELDPDFRQAAEARSLLESVR